MRSIIQWIHHRRMNLDYRLKGHIGCHLDNLPYLRINCAWAKIDNGIGNKSSNWCFSPLLLSVEAAEKSFGTHFIPWGCATEKRQDVTSSPVMLEQGSQKNGRWNVHSALERSLVESSKSKWPFRCLFVPKPCVRERSEISAAVPMKQSHTKQSCLYVTKE